MIYNDIFIIIHKRNATLSPLYLIELIIIFKLPSLIKFHESFFKVFNVIQFIFVILLPCALMLRYYKKDLQIKSRPALSFLQFLCHILRPIQRLGSFTLNETKKMLRSFQLQKQLFKIGFHSKFTNKLIGISLETFICCNFLYHLTVIAQNHLMGKYLSQYSQNFFIVYFSEIT